jgi:hypothetical protein
MIRFPALKAVLIILLSLYLPGCSYFISNASEDLGHNLTHSILNHNDPATVAEAIPAYLLLLEALLLKDPDNEALLTSTSTLYVAYINLLAEDEPDRKKRLSTKALNFALHSACVHDETLCLLNNKQYQPFEEIIMQTELEDIDTLYSLGTSWALWVQANKSDWNAIAQLAQVKTLMNRVIELDNSYKQGSAHIYLGVLATILPPALGGKPEIGKQHFETALKLSEEKNLMVKVVYAKQYARMMFDRDLHDNLLNAVINAKLEQTDLTLINTLAKKQAEDLLDSADEYF